MAVAIGEIKRGADLGKKEASRQYIFLACESCKRPRWVGLRNGIPRFQLCQDCGSRGHLEKLGLATRFGTKKHPVKGITIRSETKVKLSNINKGKHLSEETKAKLRNLNMGKKASIDTREKMSESAKLAHPRKEKIICNGYVYVNCPPEYPYSRDGRIFEHRLVMEKHIGRLLKRGEVVHHENENRTDNHIENLYLFSSPGQHAKYHKEKSKKLCQNAIA